MRLQKLSLQIPASRVFPWTGARSKYRGVVTSFEGKKITSTFISTATISTEELACMPTLSSIGCGNLERNWGAAAYVKQGAQYNDELTMNPFKEAKFHRHILSHYVSWNGQKSLCTSQITILTFPNICFLAIYVQLKAKPRRGIFHGKTSFDKLQ